MAWSAVKTRRRVAGLVAAYRWYVLAAGAVIAYALGLIGWSKFLPVAYPGRSVHFSDVAYWSFKDFLLNSPQQPGLPWQLDVARFLAPLVAGWAGLSALGVLFRDRMQQMRIPLMRGHVVVCGVGSFAGSVFVRKLYEQRVRVVVVDMDADTTNIEMCRNLGVPVIVGDAQRQRILRSAGTQRASRVVAITTHDAVNAQIVAAARQLAVRRQAKLRYLALIANPDFCRLLQVQEGRRADPNSSLDFFNIDEIGARLLLNDFPLNLDRGQPHILVAHLGSLGAWLVYHAARAWYDSRGATPDPLVVTVLDKQAADRVEALKCRHPALEKACQFVTISPTAHEIALLPQHHRDPATPPICRAYVTASRDSQTVETALKLRRELDQDVSVVAALSRPHGVTGLIDDVNEAGVRLDIDVFCSAERTCTPELVRGGSFEPIAQGIYERWVEQQTGADPPLPTWTHLDETHREFCRERARQIPVRLGLIGCAIAPLRDWEAKCFTFTAEEIRILADGGPEHRSGEHMGDGMAAHPGADHRQMRAGRDWRDCAPFDADFVAAIPGLLAAAGRQVVRNPD